MFCQKCGKEINDEAVVCIGCGCPVNSAQTATTANPSVQNKPIPESNSTANCALLFAFLMPIVGLIMGIVGTCKYKTPSLKSKCVSAIVVSIISWIVWAIIFTSIGL